MNWDEFRQWIAAQAALGGDLIVQVDLAPEGASSPVLLTLRSSTLVHTDGSDLMSWSAGEHLVGIARDDFVTAAVDDESPSAITVQVVTGALLSLAWSPWPDRRHT